MIEVKNGFFHISNEKFSYCFFEKEGKLYHSYYGSSIKKFVCADFFLEEDDKMEYPEFGRGDFRVPAIVLRKEKVLSTDFRYVSYEILSKKTDWGLPALRKGGETLVVTLIDEIVGAELKLFYTAYKNGLARHAEIRNLSASSLWVDKAMSACIDFPIGEYETIGCCGRPNNEGVYQREKAVFGIRSIESSSGTTTHRYSPFLCVVDTNTNEDYGEAYGFQLIYCGNFTLETEKTESSKLRVQMGEKILYGGIELETGETFVTPEAVLVYSENGLGEMSRSFHRLYRNNLLDPRFADKIRPIVLNSWESLVYDISEESFLEFVENSKRLGVDTIVLDDGWFGKRDDDTSSLGDWFVDGNKFPNGLTPVIERCKQYGMKFGLWIEPECVSPNSELYRAHPEWAIHTQGRQGIQIRNQYVLDFSKQEVVDYIFNAIKTVLENNEISYLKWDMNRYLTDVTDAKTYHNYVQGVYDLYSRLSVAFPDILIEGCASGGGRFEPSILYYSPMIWTSDNTDAWCRAKIQYAASLCYPLQTMSNHVSLCPNNQTGRITPFSTRGAVASLGCLGYELNPLECTEEEIALIIEQIKNYRRDSNLILTGDLYRLRDPFQENAFCELIVSEDKSEAYFVYVRGLNEPNIAPTQRVRLKGLRETATYRVIERNKLYSGKELMAIGLQVQLKHGDFESEILHIKEEKLVADNEKL